MFNLYYIHKRNVLRHPMISDRPLPIGQDWLLEKLKVLVGEKLYSKEGTCFGYENEIAQAGINRNLAAAIKRLQWVQYGPPKPDDLKEMLNPAIREEFIRAIETLMTDPKFGKILDKHGNIVPEDKFENIFKGIESVAIDWIFNGTPAGHDEVIRAEELKSLIQIAQGIRASYARRFRTQSLNVPQALAEFDKQYPRFIYLINLQIFCENMVLYQSPEKEEFASLFEAGHKASWESISTDVIPLIAPIELDVKRDGITQTRIEKKLEIENLYTIAKYEKYYQTLFKHIKNNLAELRKELETKEKKLTELPFSISHIANRHCSGIMFNAETEQFIFIDANRPPPYEVGIDEISQTTMDSFKFDLFVSPPSMFMQSMLYVDSESKAMQKVISDWQNDPEFKALFESSLEIIINNLLQLVNEEKITDEVKQSVSKMVNHARQHNELVLTSANKQVFELLLKAGFDPNLRNQLGDTALLTAIKNNQEDIVELLLNAGIDPNGKNWFSRETPLIRAIHMGNKNIIKMLLDYGADPNQAKQRGPDEYFLPLHEAIIKSKVHVDFEEVITLLLNAGAKPEMQCTLEDGTELTAYQIASASGSARSIAIMETEFSDSNDKLTSLKEKIHNLSSSNLKIQKIQEDSQYLLTSYHGLNNLLLTALFDAIKNNEPDIVKLLLSTGINPNQTNKNGETILGMAAETGNKAIVEILLAIPGIHINQANRFGVTPLMIAAKKDADIVKLLVDAGAKINLSNVSCLTDAALDGNLNMMQILIKAGAIINLPRLGNPLLEAVRANKLDAVKLLLIEGADPTLVIPDEEQKKSPMTALTYAMTHRDPRTPSPILDSLVQHQNQLEKLKIYILSQESTEPDFIAIKNRIKNAANYYSLRKYLLEQFKNPSISQTAKNVLQTSFFMHEFIEASSTGKIEHVRELLESKVDPNTRTDYISPLFLAASDGQTAIAELLIKTGADVNFTNKAMLSPLMQAAKNGHHLIVKMLLEAGADIAQKGPIIDDSGLQKILNAQEMAEQNHHFAVVQVFSDHAEKLNVTSVHDTHFSKHKVRSTNTEPIPTHDGGTIPRKE